MGIKQQLQAIAASNDADWHLIAADLLEEHGGYPRLTRRLRISDHISFWEDRMRDLRPIEDMWPSAIQTGHMLIDAAWEEESLTFQEWNRLLEGDTE